LRGKKTSLANEEAIGRNAQGGVMMKAAPTPSFVMIEPKFLLEILIIPLNPPAQLGPVAGIFRSEAISLHQIRELAESPQLRRFS
jgi:hypothetical protein